MGVGRIRVPVVAARSRPRIETESAQFLAQFAPECLARPSPSPVLRFFDRVVPQAYGFRPEVDNLAPGLEGLTDPGARTVTLPPEVYSGLEDDDPRSRFTASHEVGHVVLHGQELARIGTRLPNQTSIVLARRMEIKAYNDPEWQADAFAGSLLMPATALMMLEDEHGSLSVSLLVRVFRVSKSAARYRLSIYETHRDKLQRVGESFRVK
ncbi:ImmA/IrrE family metallo-endopeptidase [Sorangium sp. So ce854]|uniref:ImmA/IrrE family metallo-endopeptidase n=1 Tax=Sorangium sp. So ce854 TaxID=3133322 RepID=UPI003F5DD927